MKEERKGRKTLTFNLDVVEFDRPRSESFTGSTTDEDAPTTTLAGVVNTTTTSTMTRASKSPTRIGGVGGSVGGVVDAFAHPANTAAVAPLNRVAGRKAKPHKDGADDYRSVVKASSPVKVKPADVESKVAPENHNNNNYNPSARRQRISTSSCNSDNSDGGGIGGGGVVGGSSSPMLGRKKTTSEDSLSPSVSPSVSSASPVVSSGSATGRQDRCHRETTYLTFTLRNESRTVLRGRCIGHGPRGSSTFVGMDKTDGDLVAIKVC